MKKILSFMLALCLIIPCALALTACGGKTPPNNGGENPPVLTYSDYFNGVKVIEKMSFADMSEGSEAYLFTTSVMQQIDTFATEILLRLCGYYGLGLTVAVAESYGIVIENDIIPETTAEYGIHRNRWDWSHVYDTENILTDLTNQSLYIEVYFNAYPSVDKENYKNKLILSLYELLIGSKPSNLEEGTLRDFAKKFDHLGFFEEEIDSITDFIFDNIIGEDNCVVDKVEYNPDYDRYGYFNYAVIVPQLVLDSVNRVVADQAVYPVLSVFQFSEKTVENFVNLAESLIGSIAVLLFLALNVVIFFLNYWRMRK